MYKNTCYIRKCTTFCTNTRNLGRPTVSAEATSVQRSLHFVLQSQRAGWTVRDKGDDDDGDGDGDEHGDGDEDGDGDVDVRDNGDCSTRL